MDMTLLPDPKLLNGDQLRGWACALCGARLFRDRSLGLVDDPMSSKGEYVELWACVPLCTLPAPGRRP